jgi:hypothetical protein
VVTEVIMELMLPILLVNKLMETTLYNVTFFDGRTYRVFCRGKNQKQRFNNFTQKIKNEIESIAVITNGIHTISEFEKITTNLL